MQVDKILTDVPPRPFDELVTSGLLWLINASVFHPRGLAFGVTRDPDGHVIGWRLLGSAVEPWSFPDDKETHQRFEAAQRTMNDAIAINRATRGLSIPGSGALIDVLLDARERMEIEHGLTTRDPGPFGYDEHAQ